jgi:predicted Zn-dependent peptidase
VTAFNLERLDNGLRILTAPMDSAQSVTCAIMLAAGSRYETPETNGIAHFAEHMFFKGTESRPSRATLRSTCSSTCCATRSSTLPRSNARKA